VNNVINDWQLVGPQFSADHRNLQREYMAGGMWQKFSAEICCGP